MNPVNTGQARLLTQSLFMPLQAVYLYKLLIKTVHILSLFEFIKLMLIFDVSNVKH